MKKISTMILAVIGLSLIMSIPMYARETGGALSVEVASCMQQAVETRDTKIIEAVTVYSTAVKSALTVRKDALKSAWSQTSLADATSMMKSAWAAYKKALSDARKALKTAKTTAWNAFKTGRLGCKSSTNLDTSTPSVDSQL
jgi:hypothetical protein